MTLFRTTPANGIIMQKEVFTDASFCTVPGVVQMKENSSYMKLLTTRFVDYLE